MNVEDRLVESYLDGKLPLPSPVVHGLLMFYLNVYNRVSPWFDDPTTLKLAETEEIAARASELMATHYDLPQAWFERFLGRSMKYSMGLWDEGATTLEEAQTAMMEDVCLKAEIQPGQTVLDLGCGFGSLAGHILRTRPGAKVTGLTLSATQAGYIRDRMADPGHAFSSDRFRLIQEDFNHVEFDRPFDRIVSLGVFEHVGNLGLALKKIRGFTAPGGSCFLHYIVFHPRDGGAETPRNDPFMERYIFPGGRVHAFRALFNHQEDFEVVQSWYMNGRNYSRTARAWLENFQRSTGGEESAPPGAARRHRIWEFFLRSCVVLFMLRGGNFYGNGQYLLRPTDAAPVLHN